MRKIVLPSVFLAAIIVACGGNDDADAPAQTPASHQESESTRSSPDSSITTEAPWIGDGGIAELLLTPRDLQMGWNYSDVTGDARGARTCGNASPFDDLDTEVQARIKYLYGSGPLAIWNTVARYPLSDAEFAMNTFAEHASSCDEWSEDFEGVEASASIERFEHPSLGDQAVLVRVSIEDPTLGTTYTDMIHVRNNDVISSVAIFSTAILPISAEIVDQIADSMAEHLR